MALDTTRRTDVEMAAFNAPALLVAFDVLPAEARVTYEELMEQVAAILPKLSAVESLIRDLPIELRHLLSWESQALLPSLPEEEVAELRALGRAWAERNPDVMALFADEESPGQLPPATSEPARPALLPG